MQKNYTIINTTNHDFASNNTYVYVLINPITGLPFYVGKGRDNRATRHISLRKSSKQHRDNPHKNNTINQIIAAGEKIIIEIVSSHILECDAFTHEQELIALHGRKCNNTGILTNITRGGEGHTKDGLPVDQYTLWGEFVKTWPNAKEAMRANNWKHYNTICACCKGKERSYKGFLWCYSGSHPTPSTKVKPIYQWSLNGELVEIHKSITSAAEKIGCDSSTIRVQMGSKAVGFLWSYDNKFPTYLPPNGVKRSVVNLTSGVIYDTVTDAAKANNDTISNVSAVCNKKQKTSKGQQYAYYESIPSLQ